MKFMRSAVLFACVMFLGAEPVCAQEWKGLGRVAGKVVDEAGKPVEGVIVKAVLPASQNRGPADSKTNNKGDWAVGGIARGLWALDFVKDGYQTMSISVT